MGQNTEPETLEAEQALATIDETLGHEAALRSRTEGLTWMIWGLVTAGWTLTYDAIAWIARPDGVPEDVIPILTRIPEFSLLTLVPLPWVVAGGLVTWGLWRTAALSDPSLDDERPAGAWLTAGFSAFVVALWATLFFGLVVPLDFPGTADTMGLIVLGITWATFGWVQPVRLTGRARRVCVVIGAILLATGLLTAFALGQDHPDANAIATPVAVLVGGGAPLAGGLWQALRG